MISVIIPTFNRKDFVCEALDSVMSQEGGAEFETVVVDDASTDGTRERISEVYPHVRYERFEKNRGVSAARNRGIELARGEIIAFLDSDDVWMPEHLKILANTYQAKKTEWVINDGWRWHPGKIEKKRIKHSMNHDKYDSFAHKSLVCGGFVKTLSCVSLQKKLSICAGGFDEKKRVGEDTDFLLKILERGHIPYFTGVPTVKHREHHFPRSMETKNLRVQHQVYLDRVNRHYEDLKGEHSLPPRKIVQLQIDDSFCLRFWNGKDINSFSRLLWKRLLQEPLPLLKFLVKNLEFFVRSIFKWGIKKLRGVLWKLGIEKPVLVYQMGKVASTTIVVSLRWCGQRAIHTHTLTEDHRSRLANRLIKSGRKGWKIITLVRDPVARDVSSFFQNLNNPNHPYYLNSHSYIGSLSTKELGNHFISKICDSSQHCFEWFNQQLLPTFLVDVFSKPFEKEKGFQIYNTEQAEILLIRYEDLWGKGKIALADFLKLKSDFNWVRGNLSSEKYYTEQYNAFKQKFIFPKEYLKRVYGHPYTRHFYTNDEIKSFMQGWPAIEIR